MHWSGFICLEALIKACVRVCKGDMQCLIKSGLMKIIINTLLSGSIHLKLIPEKKNPVWSIVKDNNLIHIFMLILFSFVSWAAPNAEPCAMGSSVYHSGETFFPSCSYQCVCRGGQISCVPRCNLDVMLPGPDCPFPRKVQVPGECCEKWVCDGQAEVSVLGGVAMAGEIWGPLITIL